jgi:hypothetical protein
MKINDEYNYTILSNNINSILLDNFKGYPVFTNITFEELKAKLEFFSSKRLVFNETFYNFKTSEINEIITLLKKQNIKFINITSNIEESLYGNYIVVYDDEKIILEGLKKTVLKEEKILKRLGYGLPFAVDLSLQLKIYECLDEVYYDIPSLAGELWN